MSDIQRAMDELVNVVVSLRSAVEDYTKDTNSQVNYLMNEVASLKDKSQRHDRTLRKIANAILEDQNE